MYAAGSGPFVFKQKFRVHFSLPVHATCLAPPVFPDVTTLPLTGAVRHYDALRHHPPPSLHPSWSSALRCPSLLLLPHADSSKVYGVQSQIPNAMTKVRQF